MVDEVIQEDVYAGAAKVTTLQVQQTGVIKFDYSAESFDTKNLDSVIPGRTVEWTDIGTPTVVEVRTE
jgi:hypothetical protein